MTTEIQKLHNEIKQEMISFMVEYEPCRDLSVGAVSQIAHMAATLGWKAANDIAGAT